MDAGFHSPGSSVLQLLAFASDALSLVAAFATRSARLALVDGGTVTGASSWVVARDALVTHEVDACNAASAKLDTATKSIAR